jgi:hypothetical protein
MESHTYDNQKTEKDSIFKQEHSMTLAAASVIILKFNDNSMKFNSMIFYSNNILINSIQ